MADPLDNLTSSEQLRRLLVQEEQERIDRLEARLGDDASLKDSLVPIVADVLRDAGVRDYRRLADALAPVVLQSIKTEIQNSRDMMVDALYPITGRLVAAAVRNAFKDLVEQLNAKLDKTLSVDRWRARVKAKLSGRTEAEVLLSEGAVFDIVELLLIDRQSGLLVAQAMAEGERDGGDGASSHLMSSILTAIMAFVRDAMSQSSEQDLRTLHVGDVRLHLQVSPGAILAIKTRGPPPPGFETALGEAYYAFLSRWGHVLSEPDELESHDELALTEDLEARFQSLLEAKQTNFRKPSKKGALLLGALAAAAILWLSWTVYQGWMVDRIETAARSVVDQRGELKGYPIDVSYERDANSLTVSGLAPDEDAMEGLAADLERRFPDASIISNVGLLPDRSALDNEFATKAELNAWRDRLTRDVAESQSATKADLDAWRDRLTLEVTENLSATKADLDAWRDRLTLDVTDELDGQRAALLDKVAGLEQRFPTSGELELDAFRSWIDQVTIRFDDGRQLNDETQTGEILARAAEHLSNLTPDLRLRVVGYSDDLGDDGVNADISAARAAFIAARLTDLGVPPDRLDVVGRGDERRIVDADGAGSANRRVEFELLQGAIDEPLGSDHDAR